mmetsp:Transcript_1424/g.2222  ORF Transcript_1424/g.2222 Transcript_1424/m.2222 type:complete len:83 (+) Transcript_1424:2451-2699(+)
MPKCWEMKQSHFLKKRELEGFSYNHNNIDSFNHDVRSLLLWTRMSPTRTKAAAALKRPTSVSITCPVEPATHPLSSGSRVCR